MDTNKNIFNKAPEPREGDLQDERAEVLDAWLWPATEQTKSSPARREEPTVVEVGLLPPTRRLLRDFPIPGLEWPYLRHLEQRIARDPRDLLSHVRRLHVARTLGDSDAVAGALTDLFLVLGKQGWRLRRRMLSLVGAQLTTEQLIFFETHLEYGVDTNRAMPDFPQSRLSKRVTGTTQIVTRKGEGTARTDDPVELARESLAAGHPDVAQAVLEGALESDPGNTAVCEELLDLYSDRGLRKAFRKTYTSLLGRRLGCRHRWDELARRYRVRVVTDG